MLLERLNDVDKLHIIMLEYIYSLLFIFLIMLIMKSRLKVLLAEKGLTQGELGKLLNFNMHTISDFANAKVKRIDAEKLQKLCTFFKCGIQDIIYFEESTDNVSIS